MLEPSCEFAPVNTLQPTLSSAALPDGVAPVDGTTSNPLPCDLGVPDEELDALVKEMLDAEFNVYATN